MPQKLQKESLASSIDKLRGTEAVLPAPTPSLPLPTINSPVFRKHGDAILVVIPTANKQKSDLLTEAFNALKPSNVEIHYISAPSKSDVGEQPYDDAGVEGARNRITNALRELSESTLEEKKIGTVIAASIENYIQQPTEDETRPVDYGVVMVHNATTGRSVMALSKGATAPRGYFDYAQSLGHEGDKRYGRVTVGKLLAATVPGLEKADWHAVVAGVSRYELLKEAIKGLEIPW
ncbi:hypothetical protein DL771_007444 [Monosporascus sp. 5C6A]|nr:hypothetical protein DL771_007444 [Monosporascus sp. 5C6A]